ncbi:MAG: NAD(P)H-dependent glycerol-3-phosphate dehydrogenase [Actinomycetota bacterium]|nr:NAD(P)H-dependent glycerol-3-phosphate dehydrogenase [Actinomycetota bacterium]
MIGVIGAGAMGAAMTVQLMRAGNDVWIFTTPFDAPFVDAHRRGEPHPGLGVPLPPLTTFVEPDVWADALPKVDRVVLAVATAGLVETVRAAAPHVPGDALWIVATKGWDEEGVRPASGLVVDEIGDRSRVVAVVGPSIAAEVAHGVPTAVVCASESAHAARHVAEMFDSPFFRTYTSTDVTGVEVGAIMKNIVAIAVGMCDGLCEAFGVPAMTNAKAFVFSRGLVEMAKLAVALGGRSETILGLAGAGDLFVTALAGRNGKYGKLIGEGRSPEDALEEMHTTVEGYVNARAATLLAHRHGLELPLVHTVANVLFYGLPPREAVERLVSPPAEEELT